MMNKTIKLIIEKSISPVAGKLRFQKLFEKINRVSLLCMNIGSGSDPESSGESAALNYIKSHFEKAPEIVVFDVGANVGQYSLLLDEAFGSKASIYAFEPSKNTCDKLRSNLGGKQNVKIFNLGLGNENAKSLLFSDGDESQIASVYKRNLDHFNMKMDRSEEIEIKTLDSFCEDNGIARINFLKLDVEGHEIKVLEGASKMLEAGAIDFIQFEFGSCNIDSRTYFQDFFRLLNGKYTISRIVKDGLYEIRQYNDLYEAFTTTNFLAEKR